MAIEIEKKCGHRFTAIAPEASDDPESAKIWMWCIRCGTLRLGASTFTPGKHQKMVIREDKREPKAKRRRSIKA